MLRGLVCEIEGQPHEQRNEASNQNQQPDHYLTVRDTAVRFFLIKHEHLTAFNALVSLFANDAPEAAFFAPELPLLVFDFLSVMIDGADRAALCVIVAVFAVRQLTSVAPVLDLSVALQALFAGARFAVHTIITAFAIREFHNQ